MKYNYETHQFYCLNCGKKGVPLSRNKGNIKGKNHRKKLYCPFCRKVVNHIECRDQYEVDKFLYNFNRGLYKKEALESIEYIKGENK